MTVTTVWGSCLWGHSNHACAPCRPWLVLADVDDLQWREALQTAGGPHNKQKLWPVAANGFQDLVTRKQEQVRSVADRSMNEYAAHSHSHQVVLSQLWPVCAAMQRACPHGVHKICRKADGSHQPPEKGLDRGDEGMRSAAFAARVPRRHRQA